MERIPRWRLEVPQDREVWQQICDGDVAAFDDLYREQAPRLYAFLRQMTGNTQAAEDIVQETFTEFWKRPGRYAPDSGSLGAWLFGISKKPAADWWRKRDPVAPEPDEPASACHVEISSLLEDAMARLPQQQRILLWLREVEGQSYEELANIPGIPAGTVRSRLFAAREALAPVCRNRHVWVLFSPNPPAGRNSAEHSILSTTGISKLIPTKERN
jgi:RNA polymerase sigma-70 factor, ECF subfamily